MHKFRQFNQILNEAMQNSRNKIIEIDKTYQSSMKKEEKLNLFWYKKVVNVTEK